MARRELMRDSGNATGGSPPFELVLAPVCLHPDIAPTSYLTAAQEFGTPRTFPVPSSSYTNGKGSFQAQIPFPKDHKFLAIMSDANGFGSGGASSALTVGAPVSNTNCNTTDPGASAATCSATRDGLTVA